MRWKTLKLAAVALAAPAGLAVAAVAAPFVPLTPEHLNPEPVVIEVPQEDLQRCIETLQQVFISPVEGASVQTASLSPAERGPTVTCVAK